jgi:hypothetical protein
LPAAADAEQSVALMKEWILKCVEKHSSCRGCLDAEPPHRLVDVGPADGSIEPKLVLGIDCRSDGEEGHAGQQEEKEAPRMANEKDSKISDKDIEQIKDQEIRAQDKKPSAWSPYITLSHCWGKVPPDAAWKTTSQTLGRFSAHIPMSILPRTLSQAVKITRQLGERYIWIDSLCIVQDSAEEWAKAVSEMGQVYSNSRCTIISSSDNAEGGCVTQRNPLELEAATICLFSSDKSIEKNVTILPCLPTRASLISAGATTSRAWCLQEAELSPRIIRFTEYQTLWECFSSQASESSKDNSFHDASPERQTGALYNVCYSHFNIIGWKDKAIPYNRWYSMVEEYSKRKISFEKDKLPALAGMAKRIHLTLREYRNSGIWEDTYLAGLWARDIIFGLLWRRVLRDEDEEKPPASYIAPSWSWASVKGEVEFPVNKERMEKIDSLRPSFAICSAPKNLEIAESEHQTAANEAESVSGLLIIQHSDVHPSIVDPDSPFGQVHCANGFSHLFVQGKVKSIRVLSEAHISYQYNFLRVSESDNSFGLMTLDHSTNSAETPLLWCLLVHAWDSKEKGTAQVAAGLVLAPAPIGENSNARYKRIGYIEVNLAWFDDVEMSYLTIV